MLNLQSENAFTVEEGLVEVMNKQTAEYKNICVDEQNTTIVEIKWKLFNIQRVNIYITIEWKKKTLYSMKFTGSFAFECIKERMS